MKMIEEFEREFSKREIKYLKMLKYQYSRKPELNRSWIQIISKQSIIGFCLALIICVLGYAASDNPMPTWFYFIIFFGAGTIWAVSFSFYEKRKSQEIKDQYLAIIDAINNGKAIAKRIKSNKVIELEEYEDEGASYFFEVNSGKLFYLSGQDYYSTPKFPNTDFSIIGLIDSAGNLVDSIIEKNGKKLEPYKTISAKQKLSMYTPPNESIIDCNAEEIEIYLLNKFASESST